jgi:molecular chaperone HscB
MEPKLNLDAAALQRSFYDLSRLLHPDRYTRKTPTEQQYSLQATAILNDAYRVLRDPVSRAEYLLKQSGFESGESRSKNVPPDLLEEVFELNMALEELRSGDDSARDELAGTHARFAAIRQDIDRQLLRLFDEYDSNRSRDALGRIREALDRRKYVQNLVTQVKRELVG